jgi:hypothetical protein
MIDAFGGALILPQNDDRVPAPDKGRLYYAAPELYLDAAQPTPKMDVFSFGLILFEILFGCPGFSRDEPPIFVMRRILAGDMPKIPDSCGKFMQELIPRCWAMDPESRPSFEDILNEFQANGFCILPDADAMRIRTYFCGVLVWEVRSHKTAK